MGYLTPILFYNDSIHMIREDPTINDKLYYASMWDGWCQKDGRFGNAGMVFSDGNLHISYTGFRKTWFDKLMTVFGWKRSRAPKSRKQWRGGGSFAISLKTMHADCERVVFIGGNTWTDLTDALGHPEKYYDEYFNQCLDRAERYLRMMKAERKKYLEKQKGEKG